ncbi:gustatory receptor 79 [Tribolium castaneum]|uniref:Gustatory receptor n=1 Tax=Tribolium castaneum TaxID=7070 RepID=A2AX85_TRICA|nr:gustatory receptor [Tribolium castaneum]ABY40597.1 gustatory receptor [Tribolium castaneum]EFA09287.1 gustatory receptor 79 [Tribolium castaneum]CAL23156.2 gustatory receptor candidate 23 [Tribolium castaneum]
MNSIPIETIFKFGKYTLLTPKSRIEKKPSRQKQFYALFLIFFYTFGEVFTLVLRIRNMEYRSQTLMQTTLRLIRDLSLYFSVIYSLLRVKRMMRSWYYLLTNLTYNNTNRKYYWLNVCCLNLSIVTIFFNFATKKLEQFIVRFMKYHFFGTLKLWSQLFSTFAGIEVLHVVKQCYHLQKINVQQSGIFINLPFLEHNLIRLKNCVIYFNRIFGWNILFGHIFTVCRTLIYIDDNVKGLGKQYNIASSKTLKLSINIISLVQLWIFQLYLLILCDQILREFDQIVVILSKVKSILNKKCCEKCGLKKIEFCRPTFSAARFYGIDFSNTFLGLVGAVVTFLIVLLQFQIN